MSQAEKDAKALAVIGELAWNELKDANIPQGQISDALGAIIQVMGAEYIQDRARYLEPEDTPGEFPVRRKI